MVTSGFFNSVNGDRRYSAEQMSAIFNGIINDGVFVNVGTAFAVTADVGNQVTVGSGRAWIDSTWINNDTILLVQLGESDVLTPRIDAVILETDHSAPVRNGTIKVIEGSPASKPVRPKMEHSFYVNQYPLAYILRPANSTSITQSNITYMVGTSELPFVTGILETLDIDALVAQWGAEWKEWFESIKATTSGDIIEYQEAWDQWFQGVRDDLTEDAAGNLLLKIEDVENDMERYEIHTKGDNISSDHFYTGNIDTDFLPDDLLLPNRKCGAYIIEHLKCAGTFPPLHDIGNDRKERFLLSVPAEFNGLFQMAVPIYHTNNVSGKGVLYVREYLSESSKNGWTPWGELEPFFSDKIHGVKGITAHKWFELTYDKDTYNMGAWKQTMYMKSNEDNERPGITLWGEFGPVGLGSAPVLPAQYLVFNETGIGVSKPMITNGWAAFVSQSPLTGFRAWLQSDLNGGQIRLSEPSNYEALIVAMEFRKDVIEYFLPIEGRFNISHKQGSITSYYVPNNNEFFYLGANTDMNTTAFMIRHGATGKERRLARFRKNGDVIFGGDGNSYLAFIPGVSGNSESMLQMNDPDGADIWFISIPPKNSLGYSNISLNLNAHGSVLTKNIINTYWGSGRWNTSFKGHVHADNISSSSSILIKENIRDIGGSYAENVLHLRPVVFDFIDGEKDRIGLIAEEVEEYFPEVVDTPEAIDIENHRVKSIDYSKLVTPLIKMVQIQQGEIDEQRRKNQELEERIERLELMLAKM